jgi:serine/threonine protein kinase
MQEPSMEITPEEWRQLEELYHAARERPAEREALIAQAEPEIRRKLQLLLAQDDLSGKILDHPVKGVLDTLTMAAVLGKQLGPYQIEALLGKGGMGEVFRARDSRLGRAVALKLLPDSVSSDPVALERFQREARAVSALNHPNICTLHDIGEDGGRRFLVLELLEGQNMQDRLRAGALAVPELLAAAVQVSEALDAAHRKGIVHRDLKPANLFRMTDGRVKILDFGIARYAGESPRAGNDTTMSILTRHGSFTGTLAYASPEQIRGETLDARTDMFSLGLTLYEMATGQPPYPGASLGRMLVENPGSPVEAPSRRRKDLPPALDAIILQLLKADPADRFQSAAELCQALKEVRARPLRRSRAAVAVAAALVIAAGTWLLTLQRKTPASLEYTRLTNFPDSVHSPMLSKDGKLLVFVRGGDPFNFGPGEIYLKTLPDGQPVQLTHDDQPKMAPVLSPDGSRIVYTTFVGGWSSMSVPISGGKPLRLMRNAASLTWVAPNRVLFSEVKSLNSLQMAIVTATDSRAEPRDIYLPQSPVGMAHFSLLSPNGKWLLVVEMDMNGWLPCRLLPFDGSSSGKPVGPNAGCTAAAWSPDGKWMYFVAGAAGESHLWRQLFPDGRPEQVTFGVTEERGIAVEPDGRSLITSVGAMQGTVFYHDQSRDRPVSVEGYAFRPQVSHDGRKVYYLVRRAAKESFWIGELWSADVRSSRSELMLPGFLVHNYHVSQDDRHVVFDAFDASGQSRVWIATTDRSEPPRKLSLDGAAPEQRPFFGASGNIYFLQEQPQGVRLLYMMNPDGSGQRQLSSDPLTYLVNISPDEKWALIWQRNAALNTIALPIGEGGPKRVVCSCATEPIFQDSPRVSWSSDGRIMFVNVRARSHHGGASSIAVPVRTHEALPAVLPPEPEPADLMKLPGVFEIPELSVAPGPPGIYAYVRETQQRNLFRIRIP